MDSDFGNHPVELVFRLDRANRKLAKLSVYPTTKALCQLAIGPLNYEESIDARQEQPLRERQAAAIWLRLADRFVWLTATQAATLREQVASPESHGNWRPYIERAKERPAGRRKRRTPAR